MADLDLDALTTEIETRVLPRRRLASLSPVTRALLAEAEISTSDVLGTVTDSLVVRMESLVTADERKERRVEAVTGPLFNSWQEQRVESLPLGSLRRRFWARVYGLDHAQRYGYRVRHGFRLEKDALYPEHALAGELGPLHVVVRGTSEAAVKEPLPLPEIDAQRYLRVELPDACA